MTSSPIFSDPTVNADVESKLKTFLNSQGAFLSESTVGSTRAVGDGVQTILESNFDTILGDLVGDYSSNFGARAMADLAFADTNNNYHIVDVKTHNLDTKFNMPNLTSVHRLSRFYEDDTNFFDLLIVAYRIDGLRAVVEEVYFKPIEGLSWDCLTIGALGWGQIQIVNSNRIIIEQSSSRRDWMIALCDRLFEFYPAEIAKISERISHFKTVKDYWVKKAE